MHGTSHWLGLDVHDVGAYVKRSGEGEAKPRPLETGMAFTIEPGLYIGAADPDAPDAFKGIGVRIEDNIVVANEGIVNLNRGIPKKVDEIEAWVRGQD
jgi:Xaa-Pro aminopeptidase